MSESTQPLPGSAQSAWSQEERGELLALWGACARALGSAATRQCGVEIAPLGGGEPFAVRTLDDLKNLLGLLGDVLAWEVRLAPDGDGGDGACELVGGIVYPEWVPFIGLADDPESTRIFKESLLRYAISRTRVH